MRGALYRGFQSEVGPISLTSLFFFSCKRSTTWQPWQRLPIPSESRGSSSQGHLGRPCPTWQDRCFRVGDRSLRAPQRAGGPCLAARRGRRFSTAGGQIHKSTAMRFGCSRRHRTAKVRPVVVHTSARRGDRFRLAEVEDELVFYGRHVNVRLEPSAGVQRAIFAQDIHGDPRRTSLSHRGLERPHDLCYGVWRRPEVWRSG